MAIPRRQIQRKRCPVVRIDNLGRFEYLVTLACGHADVVTSTDRPKMGARRCLGCEARARTVTL